MGEQASLALDKPVLNPLPDKPFDLSQWSRANIDYHLVFDTNYYSVPYNLGHELMKVRSTPTTVEIFHKGQRVASHLRARGHGHTVTIAERRPRSHQSHVVSGLWARRLPGIGIAYIGTKDELLRRRV